MIPVVVSWSGGKDSAMALAALQASPDHEVVGLLTTVDEGDGRIGMHGVRGALLAAQAAALGLPLDTVALPAMPSNEVYEAAQAAAFARCHARGVATIAFGDLFLADLRAWREALVARHAMTPLFPLWGRDTRALVEGFIADGGRAVTVAVDLDALPARFAGCWLDAAFVADLPAGVDPCGENGEFHTFVTAGPGFAAPIAVRVGAVTTRGRFAFADLL